MQRDFFQNQREHGPNRHVHGGAIDQGKRKLKRPLDPRKPVHLVLKSSHAKGKLSLLGFKNRPRIEIIVRERARQFGIKLHDWQNVGNHLHLVASFKRRENLQDFLRTIAALIARHVTGARRGKPFGKRFWDRLAFSRVIFGRVGFGHARSYVVKNRIEAEEGIEARKIIEQYEDAQRKARVRNCDVWDVLASISNDHFKFVSG